MRFAEIFKTELFSKYGQKAGCYINEIYDILKAIAAYPDYLDGLERRFVAYSDKLEAVVKSEEYEKYTYPELFTEQYLNW